MSFNPLKHHIQWAKELFNHYRKEDYDELIALLDRGNNLLCDYYYGEKSMAQIGDEIKLWLERHNLFEQETYRNWIGSVPSKFRNLQISDGSEWTLLIGDEKNFYLHIHPARHSEHTIRVRFLALKTALLLKLLFDCDTPEIEVINQVRKKHLRVSPIKTNGDISHILRIYSLFSKLPVPNS